MISIEFQIALAADVLNCEFIEEKDKKDCETLMTFVSKVFDSEAGGQKRNFSSLEEKVFIWLQGEQDAMPSITSQTANLESSEIFKLYLEENNISSDWGTIVSTQFLKHCAVVLVQLFKNYNLV